jgi:hypothetical protein
VDHVRYSQARIPEGWTEVLVTLDRLLAEELGSPAAGTLSRWAEINRLRYGDPSWFTNGRSGAKVAAVDEHQPGPATRRVILKYEPPDGPKEAGRLRDAWLAAPGFAAEHLPRALHDPIPIDGGESWILIQELAGADLEQFSVATELLEGARRGGARCDRESFAQICVRVTAGILGGLAGAPSIERMTLTQFLARHFADRTQPGTRLSDTYNRYRGNSLQLEGEPELLPNPFQYAFAPPSFLDTEVRAIVGRAHGDLHTGNILVRSRPQIEPDRFYLVDLARYQDRAPLSADPVQLVLSVVNRTMGELSPDQRETLLDLLATGGATDTSMLPAWLTMLIENQQHAVNAWLEPWAMAPEWRALYPLSVLAGALIFCARPSTLARDRTWFVRLAARAAAHYEATIGVRSDHGPSTVIHRSTVEAAAPDDRRQDLCQHLPELRQAALREGRLREVDNLVALAKQGHDIREAFAQLVRELFGEDDPLRTIPGLGLGRPGRQPVYVCPVKVSCGRLELRSPSGPAPSCSILGQPMAQTW